MFEALVITLREGVEAVLVLAIALATLRRRGQAHLSGALYAGCGAALLLSIGVAALATRVTWNEELAEGIAMLIGAVLVTTLVIWMWRAAPHMKAEIESGVARATGRGGRGGVCSRSRWCSARAPRPRSSSRPRASTARAWRCGWAR